MLVHVGTMDMRSPVSAKPIKEIGKLLDKLLDDGLVWKENKKRNISQSRRSRTLLCWAHLSKVTQGCIRKSYEREMLVVWGQLHSGSLFMGIQGEVANRMETLARQGGSVMLDLGNKAGIFFGGCYSSQRKPVLIHILHLNVNHSFIHRHHIRF